MVLEAEPPIEPETDDSAEISHLFNQLASRDELAVIFDSPTKDWLESLECSYSDVVGYSYGILLENGLDPDTCLEELGILLAEEPADEA